MPTGNGVGKPGAGEPHARFDGRELETRYHRPWPPQWDNLPGNRGNTRLRDLPSIHVHAPAPDPTVWLYHRFPLSLREVEEMMMARGIPQSDNRSPPKSRVSLEPYNRQCENQYDSHY
jgi:hypothetical protein